MKRLALLIAVLFSLPCTSDGSVESGDKADSLATKVSECRGVDLSPGILDVVANAKEDPGRTFRKGQPVTIAIPGEIRCASKLWRLRHQKPARSARKNKQRKGSDVATRSAASEPGRPSEALSPAGRTALSRALGTGGREPYAQEVIAYAAPPDDHRPVVPVRTRPLREMPIIPPPHRGEGHEERIPEPMRPELPVDSGGPEPFLQTAPGAAISAPTATGLNFAGVGVGLAGFTPSSNPPDTNGRVGATQYVQWNNTSFAVFNKTTGALLYGPAAGNTLFQQLGGACASHNDGDPVVAYDILAGRWLLSQFVVGASPSFSHQCVAVSVTQDATGSYYLYDFVTDPTNFVDYPKIGVWPDGYYMTSHVFNAAGTAQVAGRVSVFERQKMILGQAARQVAADLSKKSNKFQYGFVPADLDSLTPPPPGEAEFVLGPDPAFTNRTDSTRVAVTWGTTPTIALTEATISVGITTAPCVSNTSGQQNRDCVPQPSPAVATDDLDNLAGHYLYRLAYRNFGGSPVQESLVVNATVAGSASTPAHGAERWFEFRNAGNSTATPTSFQAATFDPDTAYRWMGSIAMDKDHNIALGYSKSSPSVLPGIYMTGRLGTDSVNTMGAETTVLAGSGVQFSTGATGNAGNRWGDYSAMTLDPVDQCTFWYTNEYLPNNGAFNWSTRIASYKFPSCTAAATWGTISGTITSCATGAPLSGVVVTLSNGFAGASDASGNYSISVPAGIYTATAADTDRACSTGSPATVDVPVSSGSPSTQNFCMTGSSNIQFNAIAINDSQNGNGNGVINANECVNLNVTVKNNGCANESAIAATLTTSTTGVTVTQNSSAYPNLAIDASSVNSVPFKIQTSNTFVCGSVINLTLNLTYASGSKAIGMSVPTCAGGPSQSIPTSSITLSDSSQPDRLGRDGNPSTCNGKGCPGAINTAGTRNYKKFTFTNNGGAPACITVQINAACGSADIESAAYANSYTPPTAQGDAAGNLCLGYLGDSGVSGLGTTLPSASYSFQAPANSNFVVVVNTTTGSTTCAQFSGLVSGFFDFTQGPGACPACPATPTITPSGPTIFCNGGSVTLTSSAASGNQWYLNNSAIGGATNNTYNAVASGNYSVATTASGCTSAPSAATTVAVNPIPSTPTASNSGPYCEGATILLFTPLVSGATYSWTGPNGFSSALQNPTLSNAAVANGGSYSVTVTVNGCTSAAGSTSVVVNTIPATPTASNGGPFCQGATITLFTAAVSGATYSWTGPNGFTSALQNPTRANAAVADGGSYSVTVTVNGCTSAAGSTSVVVNPTPATPSASNGGPYCPGATISLLTPTVSGATYSWSGPNGFSSTSQNPTLSNASVADGGSYSVTVTVNGCVSAAGSTSVVVNATPATPTASNGGPYCEGATIALSTPTVSGATYSWTGPNGFTSAIQNPTRSGATTSDAGSYSITVTVNGCPSAAGSTSVVVNAIPATPTASNDGPYCEGATISLSTPAVSGATYSWTGPNGFTSTLQNPTHSNVTVADAGSYSVAVTVNGCTSTAGSTSVVVNATPATPAASNDGPYCEGATISLFTPTVSGATYSWTGPNGFTSALQNPTLSNATVADAGSYSVTVIVNGCTSAAGSTSVVVNTIPATPAASNGGPYCEGTTISLTTPAVSGATYSWTGPNGFTSALQNPTRSNATVADAGSYSVTVTVNGCTSAAGLTTVTVNATPATPAASNSGPYCEGATISLSTPTLSGATYSWTGPNGFTSALQNPTRSNATVADAGSYSVTVTVNGCSSAAGSTSVVVNATPATPTASNGGPYCEGATISLFAPTVSGATYSWTGPNGFTSALQNPTRSGATTADAGSYSVTVTVNGCTSAAGSTSVVVNTIPATPAASNGGPFCQGATITLATPAVSGATYSWTGPNGFTSALQNPTRANATVADGGSYSVTVTVNGCNSAAGSTSVVVNATPATPTPSNGGPYCEGATISLSTPTVSGATYSWTGPNGFTSALQNPTRSGATTSDAGSYSVTATVNGCPSAAGSTNVVVNAIPATPTAANGGPYCEGATISLSTPTVSGATYSWTGPNGFTSALQNPTLSNASVADASSYSVTVTVNGCTSAAGSTSVVVNTIPATPTASNGGPYCEGATISLTTPAVSGATYSWTGPNGFTSALQNPTRSNATVADAGSYSVTVTVDGCTSAAGSTNVVVNTAPATPAASNGGPFCQGATITLATPTVSGATYSWSGPNSFTSSLQNPTRANTTVADAGSYSVTVTVSGCTSAAGSTNVVVNATPATPTASNGGPYCEGSTISLSTRTVSGATYSWSGPNGFTSALQNPTHANATVADAGSYSVTVTINGCTSAAGSTSVVVNPIPATPTASNGGPFCQGATITLFTPTVSGATYSWTGPNGFTSSLQNPTRVNATVADAGSYSVTVTVNGCTSAAGSTSVVVNPIPATPTASNGGPYCEGATISLSTPTVSGATYSWTGPNGFTSALQNPTHTNATLADAGSYSVTVTVNGCTSAAGSTSVVVNATPTTPSPSNGGPYCQGATISLFAPTVTGATYTWTGPGSFTSSQQNPTRSNAALADAGGYSVTVTVNGCPSAAGSTNVVVNAPPPAPTISAGGPTTFCAGGSVTLTSSSPSGNQWYQNASLIIGATGNTYNATASGNYTVVVTTNGCSSAPSAPTSVTVNPASSTPTITAGGPTTFCNGGSVLLTSSSASGYQWSLGGIPISGAVNQTYSATASGNYTVVVTNGCSSAPSAATTVTVNPIPATPTINAGGSTTFCSGGSVTLMSSSPTGNQWYLNGVPLSGETGSSTVATLAGGYSVVVTASGCSSAPSAVTTVTVNPKPNVTIDVASPMFSGASAIASVIHECAGATFSWSITGGTITSGNGTRSITFTAGGAGTLTLFVTVTNSFGCSDSKSADVTVQPPPPFGAPPNFRATATGTTSTNLIWAAVASADHYEIDRSTDNVNWTLRGTSTSSTFSESGLTPSTTYLYKVRAVKADATVSGFSTIDPATTIVFTDESLTACPIIIKAVHVTELRTAVNDARTAVGLPAFTFTDPSLVTGSPIKAVHLTELRTALAGVLSAIGVTPTYTDPTIVAGTTNVKGAHLQELRDLIH